MILNVSKDAAKFFLGQRPDGTALEMVYDQSNLDTNLTEGVHGVEERQKRITTPMILSR